MFTRGSALESRELIEHGIMLPWWTDPDMEVAFLRPLSALTHFIDQYLWPTQPALMHLHSLLWFALLLLAVAKLFGHFSSSRPLAAMATLLYSVDDARGATLSWLANRNALIAACFACTALALHDQFRRNGKALAGAGALGCFLCALSAGEIATGVLGYLVAYEVLLVRSSLLRRALSVLPYLVITAVWRIAWTRAGYGVRGSGAYVDPLLHPAAFLAQAPAKWLLLLAGQFGVVPSDLAFVGPSGARPWLVMVALATVLGTAALLVRSLRDRLSCFWLVGMLLALLPMAATFESDRSLTFVGLGASQLLARAFLDGIACHATGALSFLRRAGLLALAAVHLVLAPLLLPLRAAQMGFVSALEERALTPLFALPELESKVLVLVTAPSPLLPSYAELRCIEQRLRRPRSVLALTTAPGAVELRRTAVDELWVEPEAGFGSTPLERHYRARFEELAVGAEVRLGAFSARTESTFPDGRPRAVRFRFTERMDRYLFACWDGSTFVGCELPPVGAQQRLRSQNLTDVLWPQDSSQVASR